MEPLEGEDQSQTSESPTWSTSDSSADSSDSESGYAGLDDSLGACDNYPRFIGLCKELRPSVFEDTIKVSWDGDGDRNRLIGLSFSDEAVHYDLMLRIPAEQGSIPRAVAVLQYLENHTKIVAPRVVKWDATGDNALGHGYVIITQLPGDSYDIAELHLTHD